MIGHRHYQMHVTIIITAAMFLVIPLSMATCYLDSKGVHTKEHAGCSRIQEKEFSCVTNHSKQFSISKCTFFYIPHAFVSSKGQFMKQQEYMGVAKNTK